MILEEGLKILDKHCHIIDNIIMLLWLWNEWM